MIRARCAAAAAAARPCRPAAPAGSCLGRCGRRGAPVHQRAVRGRAARVTSAQAHARPPGARRAAAHALLAARSARRAAAKRLGPARAALAARPADCRNCSFPCDVPCTMQSILPVPIPPRPRPRHAARRARSHVTATPTFRPESFPYTTGIGQSRLRGAGELLLAALPPPPQGAAPRAAVSEGRRGGRRADESHRCVGLWPGQAVWKTPGKKGRGGRRPHSGDLFAIMETC